jgi:hypothetical protein
MFGETVPGHAIPVLNEREVRAGAGILFFISTVVFLGAWHADQMLPAQMMIIGFFIDFAIRVTAPRYAPSLVLGRLAVAHQAPEYTAAAPKRFAWWIGLALAAFMVVTLIFMHHMSLLNFAICAVCIVLLFLESAFGVCLGCIFYNKLLKREMALCPGGVCEVREKAPIQRVNGLQWGGVALFSLAMFGVLQVMEGRNAEMVHQGPNHPLIQELKGNPATPPAPAPMDHSQHRMPAPVEHAHHH